MFLYFISVIYLLCLYMSGRIKDVSIFYFSYIFVMFIHVGKNLLQCTVNIYVNNNE